VAKQPLLSIIITSYTANRLKDIFELLDSLKNQTYSNIEIIHIAERSRELYERVKDYAEKNGVSNIKMVFYPTELGISEARNTGVRHARGDIIAFIDDDAVPSTTWAEEIVKTFVEHTDIIGVSGPVLPLFEDPSLKWFPEEFYWMIGCTAWKGLKEKADLEYAWGVNMAFRKEAFNFSFFKDRYTKGVHEEGKIGPVGDDWEFSFTVKMKTGKRILYNPNVKVLHKVSGYKLTSKFIRRYAFWQGYSNAMFKDKLKATRERLKTEYDLLHKIIFRLIPSIAREFMANRNVALKKLKITVEALLYFSFGYISYFFLD
jgi:glycosyltransferase involved in cell wall biosynthesis